MVGVSNGDTITVLVGDHDSVMVRLTGIDAPEKAQPFGSVSKKNLSDHVYERNVAVEWKRETDTVEFLVECWSMEPMCAWSRFVQDWLGIISSTPMINRQV